MCINVGLFSFIRLAPSGPFHYGNSPFSVLGKFFSYLFEFPPPTPPIFLVTFRVLVLFGCWSSWTDPLSPFLFFSFFLFFFFSDCYFLKFILFLAALGLCCCARVFSSCGERGLLFVVMHGLLIVVASLVAEHGL